VERRKGYANPARTGIEPEILNWLPEGSRPQRIAYLSYSAGTLHRDLTALTAAGYRVERIIPYDFFPWSRHVETLVLLVREHRE
jgi:23S rRNA (uracil1939-C5)-methyltransferase